MEELVILENEQVVTTSLKIAEIFDREHRTVLKAIDDLESGLAEKYADLFHEGAYTHPQNKQDYRMVYMNKDGFSLLAMGFSNTKKVLEWKLKYIDQFNKMEKAIQEVYHVSETALTNNVMQQIESKLINKIDDRLEMYEENFRPTHANKIKINNYIKDSLGVDMQPEEANLVKQRVLLMLDAESWQDVPYKKLTGNMRLIDESIQAVKGFRERRQLDLFENYL